MQNLSSSELYQHILITDFLRYFIAAGAAYLIFWILFKRQWRHRIIQQKPLQAAMMWSEFRYSMSTVLIFAAIGVGILTAKNVGYTLIYDDFAEWGWVWYFVSVALMLLLHDAYFYWTHRLMHHPKVFRHVHLVHHRSTNPSPWAAYSFHPIEAVVEAGIFVLIVFTIPAHRLALLTFLVYMITRNVLGHLGIEFLPNRFMKNRWVNWHTTTTHHDLHHKHFNGNYGLYFTWWDRWCGTEQACYRDTFDEVTRRPTVYGGRETVDGGTPNSGNKRRLFAMLKSLFALLLLVNMAAAQSPVGTWQTIDDNSGKVRSLVVIEEKNGSLHGRVSHIYLNPNEPKDPICDQCTGERRNAKIIGMNFLWGFKKNGNEWTSGNILDPENGKTYRSKIWLEDADTLKVRGYWGIFWRTQTWKRAKAGK
jgi:sterol desaturase/sphingolipid hydroxylase (fatty acid hydroxylase superfamily)/uncharacterized protein (DUF2147 family)